jgi:hypothetical protein
MTATSHSETAVTIQLLLKIASNLGFDQRFGVQRAEEIIINNDSLASHLLFSFDKLFLYPRPKLKEKKHMPVTPLNEN